MIEQKGRVVECNGSRVQVLLGPAAGCSACDAGKGCGAGVFGRLLRRRPVTVQLDNTLNAQAGESVNVGIPEQLYLGLVARLYLLPLCIGLLGAGFGNYLAAQLTKQAILIDLTALILGVLFAMLALACTHRSSANMRQVIRPELLRLVSLDDSGTQCDLDNPSAKING